MTYRDRLPMLTDSDCYAVRKAFAAHDGRTGKDTIDSTVLTLLMALDRLTTYGEGFLIGNQATLDRLILKPDAPHGALRNHIWGHVIIPGNICDPQRERSLSALASEANGERVGVRCDFQTGILYFARDHNDGFNDTDTLTINAASTIAEVAEQIGSAAFRIARRGARLRPRPGTAAPAGGCRSGGRAGGGGTAAPTAPGQPNRHFMVTDKYSRKVMGYNCGDTPAGP